ncbi:sensor histidine kinase KdpD [Ligilactobacillus sp. WILCCON 0076]|uniref:histidine kinase n=1 Tax=Ligilactobacillus ubinensis TaxID=2876789 RepID=A0A9X2FLA6_9LACO|nr:sensor histidine kinase KdpD [Ligilactobacillus ubinensis]MCP0886628.1 sensor histidine kinase KdpD [Ligilactobacillus ubinensis]
MLKDNTDEMKNLLHQLKVKNEYEQKVTRGKLKIFFGYAAGVGKTYAMLEEAQELKANGVDVIIGYLEPHNRPATTAMAKGLNCLKPKQVEYQGIKVNEFDLEDALKRKPQIILVDELAHSNIDDTKHSKRYQDVEELLAAGIDVYTTLNVQHVESFNDLIQHLMKVDVKETVPDYIFEIASEIKLVDIEPSDLIMRLRAGKVYTTEKVDFALNNFFQNENLAYLRDLALRKMTMYLASKEGATEKLLVCISGASSNERVIRAAARLAKAVNCELIGVYISNKDSEKIQDERLLVNMQLAEKLGAHITILYGFNKGELIAEYAKEKGISKIVLGSNRSNWLKWRDSLIEQLNQKIPEIDKYVITEVKAKKKNTLKNIISIAFRKKINLSDSVWTTLILFICTVLGIGIQTLGSNNVNVILIYILGVMITALVTNRRATSLIYSVAMLVVYDYIFTHPIGSLESNSNNILTFIVMFIVAFLSSTWTSKIKKQSKLDAKRAYRTEILLKTSRTLQQAVNIKDVYYVTGNQLRELLKCSVCIYPEKNNDLGIPYYFTDNKGNNIEDISTKEEKAIALWVLRNSHEAGFGTDTLCKASFMYLPITTGEEGKTASAVVALNIKNSETLDPFTFNLLTSICEECEQAVLRIQIREKQNKSEMIAKQEKLRANLLRGISHDLRTPLTTILGNTDILLHQDYTLTKAQKTELYEAIYSDATWLIDLVENLLAMTKVENNMLKVKWQPELVEDILQSAIMHLSKDAENYNIKVKIENPELIVKTDGQLIVQVIINIVNNAIKYAPKGSLISLKATSVGKNMCEIGISNDGPHIAKEVKQKIFDLFYTGNTEYSGRKGMGIGLALCKSIVEANGGKIDVENLNPSGVRFYFTLPLWRDEI